MSPRFGAMVKDTGKILNCAVEEAAMTDGKPDADKMKPVCFDTYQHVYRLMGATVVSAFSCGKEFIREEMV